MTERRLDNIEDKKQNVSMFLDLSTAFDCVEHSALVDKMMVFCFSASTKALIRNYLIKRSQMVTIETRSSSHRAINCGMPQGSILGPVL